MKRSMIAVCLLLLSPSHVIACIEDHDAGSRWFDQQTSVWSSYGNDTHSMNHDVLMNVSLFAGGSGVLILVGVLFRAMCRVGPQADSLQLSGGLPVGSSLDWPTYEPFTAGEEDSRDSSW